jgi:hypothetical protein
MLLFINGVSFGQSSVKYSLKGGLNSSNTNYSVIKKGHSSKREYDNRNSFYIGGAIEVFINSKLKNLSLQIELIYSEQGNTYDFSNFTETDEINQINMPLVLKKSITTSLYGVFGGYVGHVIHAKEKYSDSSNKFEIEGYKNFDAGLIFGLEYQFNIGFFLETRYMYGIADISKVSYPSSFIEHNYKNRVFQLGLGIRF